MLLPLLWSVVFVTGAALMLDAGQTGGHGGFASFVAQLYNVAAALAVFWIAIKLALGVFRHATGAITGIATTPGTAGGGATAGRSGGCAAAGAGAERDAGGRWRASRSARCAARAARRGGALSYPARHPVRTAQAASYPVRRPVQATREAAGQLAAALAAPSRRSRARGQSAPALAARATATAARLVSAPARRRRGASPRARGQRRGPPDAGVRPRRPGPAARHGATPRASATARPLVAGAPRPARAARAPQRRAARPTRSAPAASASAQLRDPAASQRRRRVGGRAPSRPPPVRPRGRAQRAGATTATGRGQGERRAG